MIRDSLYDAMGDLLRNRFSVEDVAEVVGADQDTKTYGVCETCSYTETIVRIWYRTTTGGSASYDYTGDFSALIRALTD